MFKSKIQWSRDDIDRVEASAKTALESFEPYEDGSGLVRIERKRTPGTHTYVVTYNGHEVESDPGMMRALDCFLLYARMEAESYILCAAIYVDTGKAEPRRVSYTYPRTGLVFSAWRHGDCFTTMLDWASRLTDEERAEIEAIQEHQLRGRNQGFLTSTGRYVDREEGMRIALRAGQIEQETSTLTSETLY